MALESFVAMELLRQSDWAEEPVSLYHYRDKEQREVQAPLSADPRLPAAVSNAGALGSVALWWGDDAGDLVRETAALTDKPFAGNFVLASDQHRRVDQALSAGLRIVSFLMGDPDSYVEPVHDAGGLVLHGRERRGSAARSRV
jgi:NAD(P)H-dependent flavin oxidoreductase YrpB (nitropropane dioxygenase family)